MKKILLAITIAIFGVAAFDRVPGQEPSAYAFTFGDDRKDKKKDPPGPPVVRDKRDKQPQPKDPPPRPKKP
jgi:hypothetical protein